jgi:hypothetical protein
MRFSLEPTQHALVAACVLAAQGVFAVVHLILGPNYPGFTWITNVLVDASLAAVWSAAALAMLVRRTTVAFFVVMLAILASLTHGVLYSMVAPSTGVGVPFLVGAGIVSFCAMRSKPAWSVTSIRRAPPPRAVPAPVAPTA